MPLDHSPATTHSETTAACGGGKLENSIAASVHVPVTPAACWGQVACHCMDIEWTHSDI